MLDYQRSDMVPSEGKSSAYDLTSAKPCIQLNAKQRSNPHILNLQILSVLQQELCTINLFPERLVTARKAATIKILISNDSTTNEVQVLHYSAMQKKKDDATMHYH